MSDLSPALRRSVSSDSARSRTRPRRSISFMRRSARESFPVSRSWTCLATCSAVSAAGTAAGASAEKITQTHNVKLFTSAPAYHREMVLIFGKDTCPYTLAAREHYADSGIPFDYINVKKDPKQLQRML